MKVGNGGSLIDAMDFWTNVSNGGKWNFIGVLGIKVRAIFKSKR